MSWAKPEPIKGGVVYGGFGKFAEVPLDDIDHDVRECLRAYIQGDLGHLAICIKRQGDGLAQEEGVLDDYPEPPDYRLLTPKREGPVVTWREFKKLVEAAGVRDDEHVDDLLLMTNTDRCNCDLSNGGHPVTMCWVPNDHFVRQITIAGREIEISWYTEADTTATLERMLKDTDEREGRP